MKKKSKSRSSNVFGMDTRISTGIYYYIKMIIDIKAAIPVSFNEMNARSIFSLMVPLLKTDRECPFFSNCSIKIGPKKREPPIIRISMKKNEIMKI